MDHCDFQHFPILPDREPRKIAHALINQIIYECNIAKSKLSYNSGYLNNTEIVQVLKDIQCYVADLNSQIEPQSSPCERYFNAGNENISSFLDKFWGSD